jgi:phosphate transport system substrate-binding protein
MQMKRAWTLALALVGAAAVAACGGEKNATPGAMKEQGEAAAGGQVTLVGAGATFPYPIYSKWFDAYGRTHPVRVNYQSIGSGGGIRQLTEKTVDFGASDAPMTAEELAKAPGTLHLPTVVGSVAVTYNLPSVTAPIRLTGPVLADIFLGEIRKWNDPRIQELNPGVTLPARDILVVHRSDGSGTSYVFTEYLTTVSPAWKQKVGTGKSVNWPTGLGAKGNEGVAGQVRQTEGAIGYVEEVYASQNQLATAALRDRAGAFVQPTEGATAAAAAGVGAALPDTTDFRVSLVDAEGAGAYPISSWTYLLVPSHFEDCVKARSLADLVRWAYSPEGDAMASQLGYAPLPQRVEELALAKWGTITCGSGNEPVLTK